MKVAIISDIHANLTALNAVLEDIRTEGCEKIFCLGDLALAGSMPDETISTIKNLDKDFDLKIIQGNTDEMIAEIDPSCVQQGNVMANALIDDIGIISADNKEYLRNLPKQLEISFNGIDILLVHGSPRRNDERISPNEPIETIEAKIAGTKANLIFCGHTHIPCGYQTNTRQSVVNVGSVGRSLSGIPKACYVILEAAKEHAGMFSVQHKHIKYDLEREVGLLLNRNFEGTEELAEILRNGK